MDNGSHSRHITTQIAGQHQLPSQPQPWARSGYQQLQGAPTDVARCGTAVPQHAINLSNKSPHTCLSSYLMTWRHKQSLHLPGCMRLMRHCLP